MNTVHAKAARILSLHHAANISVSYPDAPHHFYVGVYRNFGEIDPPTKFAVGVVPHPDRGCFHVDRTLLFGITHAHPLQKTHVASFRGWYIGCNALVDLL